MMKKWDFNVVVKDFIRENKNILDLSLYDETFEDNSFDLITADYTGYDINEISMILKKGGHFITEQHSFDDVNYKGSNPKFNLENQVEEFEKLGFYMVKSNQFYQKDNNIINHIFYMVLKKTCDAE